MKPADKLSTFADMIVRFGTDYEGDFSDLSGTSRYSKPDQDFYRKNIGKYKDWLKNLENDPMYKLHKIVNKTRDSYGGFR